MEIIPAQKEHIDWIESVIKEEFPYIKIDAKKISEKINDEKFCLMLIHQKNILLGFAEIELFPEKKEARLNAVFTQDAFRGKGYAKKLLEHMIHKIKHNKIKRIFLLVKEFNEPAKGLYKKLGFEFEKMHDKIIEGSVIEVWGKEI